MINRGADGANAIPIDQHFTGLKQGTGIHLEQARGVEDDGRWGGLCVNSGGHDSE
jgi:hypothetical protein